MKKILFVCTGNICRSPLAEGVLKFLEPEFHVSSRGIESYHEGEKPDYRAIKVAKNHGIDISGIRAKRITMEDVLRNDYIFCAARKHKEQIIRHCPPEALPKVHVLLEFTGILNNWNGDLKDPYYGTEKDFEEVFEMIMLSSSKLKEMI